MENADNPLADIGFISVPEELAASAEGFCIDPQVMLPVEFGNNKEKWNSQHITWEAIISGMLRVLIYDRDHKNADYYRKLILALRPNIKHEFTEAGIIKAKNKNFKIAIEIFQALAALFPQCATSALNLALVYEDAAEHNKNDSSPIYQEYTDLAFAAYKDSLKRDPDLAEIYYNFGYFLLKQESFKKAKEQFKHYMQLEKNEEKCEPIREIVRELDDFFNIDNLFKQAFDNISMGKEEEGIKKITRLLKTRPDFWNGWFLLGWGLRRLKRFTEAKDAFNKALQYTKPNPDLLNELAITNMELGELELSERQLKHALKLEPHNTKVISNLGVVAMKKGDNKLAKGYFKAVLEFAPHDTLAKEFIKKL
jgi:tetratricopeptide (TPR) repeat protein